MLLARAEQLMGAAEFDPILLLTLCMQDDILKQHTLYGERMLQLLEPMLSESSACRQLLLGEVRAASFFKWPSFPSYGDFVFLECRYELLWRNQEGLCAWSCCDALWG